MVKEGPGEVEEEWRKFRRHYEEKIRGGRGQVKYEVL